MTSPAAGYFESQAAACDRLGSPFTARLCRVLPALLDESSATGRRVRGWPGDPRADALALRCCGGLQQIVFSGDTALAAVYPPHEADDAALAKAIAVAIETHDDRLARLLDSAPQTNEIARSGVLLPGFLAIARETGLPLSLCEIGASAGLNLLFDRFHYTYGGESWGDPTSPAGLAPEIRGAPPPLSGSIDVTDRSGCDIAPVDVSSETDRLRLRSYVWPDQPERVRRLNAAIALASAIPFSLERADAADFVRRRLADRRGGAVFVLFHSIMWQYMPGETREEILAVMEEAGATSTPDAPLAHLRMEPLDGNQNFATLSLTMWPGGETRRLTRCDFHGRWIEWID